MHSSLCSDVWRSALNYMRLWRWQDKGRAVGRRFCQFPMMTLRYYNNAIGRWLAWAYATAGICLPGARKWVRVDVSLCQSHSLARRTLLAITSVIEEILGTWSGTALVCIIARRNARSGGHMAKLNAWRSYDRIYNCSCTLSAIGFVVIAKMLLAIWWSQCCNTWRKVEEFNLRII